MPDEGSDDGQQNAAQTPNEGSDDGRQNPPQTPKKIEQKIKLIRLKSKTIKKRKRR